MKAFVISDLHVDHIGNGDPGRDKILRYLEPKLCPADILIIGGDTSDSAKVFAKTINTLSEMYSKVLFCFGNHDFTVHSKREETSYEKLNRIIEGITAKNAICLNGNSHDLSDHSRIGGTMGAYDFSYSNKHFGYDFEKMLVEWKDWYDGRHWKLGNKNYKDVLNEETEKLERLINKDLCNIMVTHIGPLAWDIPSRFHCIETGFFYFDGQKYLDSMPSGSTWIFGHTHDQKVLDLGNVRLLCNPLGYPGEIRYTIPKEEFIIDVS